MQGHCLLCTVHSFTVLVNVSDGAGFNFLMNQVEFWGILKSFSFSSRSVELNGFAALRDQYIGTPVSTHYQYLPHLFSYSAHSALMPPQTRSLDPQSHSLINQLVSAEDLEPLGTPMLIEDG